MNPGPEFGLRARTRSFAHAFRGLAALMATQPNAWIHGVATLGVVGGALWLGVTQVEGALLALAVASVWAAEAFNTAVESLGDAIATAHDERIGRAKDVAAAAVLVTAFGAVGVGLFVFGPKLLRLAASAD